MASTAWSQTIVTGGISGTVTDSSGATVEGASVTLKNAANGESQTQVTSESGIYQFALLKPGDYIVTVSRDGFKTASQKVTVQLGQTLSVIGVTI
jgi:hypothetical protein